MPLTMTPVYVLLTIFLVLVTQTRSHSRHSAFSSQSHGHRDHPGGASITSLLWKNSRNSTGSVQDGQRNSRSHRCHLHNHCRRHEFCSCSSFCTNLYAECKRKRDVNGLPEEEEKDSYRNQRECEYQRTDARSDGKCTSHYDCGCNRHCSCHGYCTVLCNNN